MRKSFDGHTLPELTDPITLSVKTRCPSKYILLDCETNETYQGTATATLGTQWKKIENIFDTPHNKLNYCINNTSFDIQEILDAVDKLLKL